ncbi:hypothetical protein AFLA_002280 [Aspergillus flavus NRRL3357]|nr:hypothetical protein AFLA_002280 [Aspergillus flavus NRRL3357]
MVSSSPSFGGVLTSAKCTVTPNPAALAFASAGPKIAISPLLGFPAMSTPTTSGFLGEMGAGTGDGAEFKVFDAVGVEVG